MKRRYTNRLNLPLPIVEAVLNDAYDSGKSDFTATSLLQPVRMRRLVSLFPEETVDDVADCLYRLHGQAVHLILERAAQVLRALGYIVEERFYKRFEVDGQIYLVSAQVDLFNTVLGVLQDYKTSSVFALMHGLKDEHRYQLNLQQYLIKYGFRLDANDNEIPNDGSLLVKVAEIVGLFRDWFKSRARANKTYPQEPAVIQDVPFLEEKVIEDWVIARIRENVRVATISNQAELPECTDAETWTDAEDDSWAVWKPGNQKASRVFDTEAEAEVYLAERLAKDPTGGYFIKRNYSVSRRCLDHCPARHICEQWKNSPRRPIPKTEGCVATLLEEGVTE